MNYKRFTFDHSDRFYDRLKEIAEGLQCDPFHLLATANAESGVSAKAENPTSSATGLLQWMAPHWRSWGFTRSAFGALRADAQVEYVYRYLRPWRGKLPSAAAVYTAVFLPAFVGKADDPTYVLCARGAKLGWAYTANAVFDANGDGVITVDELDQAIRRNWAGERCYEMVQRAGLEVPTWVTSAVADDLTTTIGIQKALAARGYSLGPAGIDGVPGKATRAAVIAFQRAHDLEPDGLVGPKTRAAIIATRPSSPPPVVA